MENKHREIIEVRTVLSDLEANNHLAHGWILLSTGAIHVDNSGYQSKTYFTLGRREEKKGLEQKTRS